jgi:hypothetical protein
MKTTHYIWTVDIDHGYYIGGALPTYEIDDVLSSDFDCCSLNEDAPAETLGGCWGSELD